MPVDRMIPTPEEAARRKQAIDSIVEDSWRGPEERPISKNHIGAYYGDNKVRYAVGYFDSFSNTFHNCVEHISWHDIICWHPIDFGPMPERFKIKEKKES